MITFKIVWFVQQSCRNLSTKRGKVVQRKLKCQTLFGPATELKKKSLETQRRDLIVLRATQKPKTRSELDFSSFIQI